MGFKFLMGFPIFCRWSLIAGRLPGRTDNEIKNYWNTHIRRKLMNRGIDPATHRPVNEPAPEVATISFAGGAAKEEEEEEDSPKSELITKEEKIITSPIRERVPDLNLELRISPPYQQQHQPDPLMVGGRNSDLCFACSLGIQNSKECSCNNGCSSSSNSGYDFLGLDYRSLEMK